jgi:PIN domain nuclease of toxin-antitoxin system
LGIGLGDCACIATGMTLGVPIYTGDRDWLKLQVEADIKLIR